MLIDWFTVGAQIVNFVVLVYLLKRFLYKPILTAIDAREAKILTQQRDLAHERLQAQQEHDSLDSRQLAFASERAALLAATVVEAGDEKTRLLLAVRTEAQALRVKIQGQRERELVDLEQGMTRMLANEVFSVSQSALRDLASVDVEHRMLELFVGRLDTLTSESRQSLGDALRKPTARPVLRSRFALTTEDQTRSQAAIDKLGACTQRLVFENLPESIGGIEFDVSGQRVSWSFAEYLRSLQAELTPLLPMATP